MIPDGRDPVRDGALDVPTAAVPTGGSDRRRANAAMGAVVLVVGAGIALSVLSGGRHAAPGATPGARAAGPTGSLAAASPGRPIESPPGVAVERLPDIANVPLPGAGRPLLIARHETDAQVLSWSPGEEGVVIDRTFADAFSRVELPQITSLAPDGRSLLVFMIEDFETAGRDRAVLFDEHGDRVWDRSGVTALSGATWSADSGRFAVTGDRGTWILAGQEGDAFAERTVKIADRPAPSASAASVMAAYDERMQPIGFSEDGRWVFGAHYSATDGMGAPFIRVSFASGAVQELGRLPSMTGGSGLLGDSGGRSFTFVFNASTPGGPPTLAVRDPDGTVAFRVETGQLLGSAFADSGRRVIVLTADGFATAGRVRLIAYDHDGRPAEPMLDVGPITNAALVGVRDGFAAVVLSTTTPERAGQLIVIRLADGRASAVRLSADDVSAVVGSGWLSEP